MSLDLIMYVIPMRMINVTHVKKLIILIWLIPDGVRGLVSLLLILLVDFPTLAMKPMNHLQTNTL